MVVARDQEKREIESCLMGTLVPVLYDEKFWRWVAHMGLNCTPHILGIFSINVELTPISLGFIPFDSNIHGSKTVILIHSCEFMDAEDLLYAMFYAI